MSVSRTLPCLLTVLLLACTACSAPRARPSAPITPAPAAIAAQNPATVLALARARAKVEEARRLVQELPAADNLLTQAQAAAQQGQHPRAQGLALEAQGRAELALDGHYVAASARELQDLYTYTGLSDAQLDRLREAEVALVRGEGARAYGLLTALSRQLRENKRHRVGRGESLWSISARPEVYANGYLWPLIWDANRDRIPNPDVLQQGQTLRIKANPTVDEVVQAVDTARRRLGARVRIGPIQRE